MTYTGLLIGYLIIILSPIIGMWHKSMPRLEQKPIAAFIPFYQYFVLLKATKLPWYWVIFLLFPGIQFVMFACLNVTFIRKFGEFGVKETILGILFPWPVFIKIANNPEKYPAVAPTNWDIAKQVNLRKNSDHVALFFALPVLGHILAWPIFSALQFKKKPGKKTVLKECGDAILFAVIAASAIRTYVFEPFQIPTGSMEKTLMVGDHLFVDKITYGPRVPMTPFSYPVFHNTIPWLNVKSYSEVQKIPYTRIPGFSEVERNDVVVFNFPAGDTSVNDPRMPSGLMGHTYEQIIRNEAFFLAKWDINEFEAKKGYYMDKARKQINNDKVVYSNIEGMEYDQFGRPVKIIRGIKLTAPGDGLIERPVDKREHYIKRCVGVPGDVIEVKSQILLVNGQMAWQAPGMQTSGMPLEKGHYQEALQTIKFKPENTNVQYYPIFPNDPRYDWTEDNFGPLKIPAKGDVIELTTENLPLYRRIITAYERHTLQEKADGIYIDGQKVTQYTIEQDYYWLMGDNRNNSADSRFWGFVPDDHVVGHASFIFFSRSAQDGAVQWGRMFTGIK